MNAEVIENSIAVTNKMSKLETCIQLLKLIGGMAIVMLLYLIYMKL